MIHTVQPKKAIENGFVTGTRQEPVLIHQQAENSASLCSLAVRYDNPIPTRFLAPIDCLKIPALDVLGGRGIYSLLDMHQDVFNRKFCGNGVPDWAAVHDKYNFPYPLEVNRCSTL
jgi:hypothetical protein